MGLGSQTLTSASGPFTAADVGKAILVSGAGLNVNGNALSATITAYTNATTVTVSVAAAVAVNGVNAVYGTDDTAAVKTAVAAVTAAAQADRTNFAKLACSAGIYVLAGAPTAGGATKGNAQVPLPVIADTSEKVTLVFEGPGDASAFNHWNQTSPQLSGALFFSTLVGQGVDGTWGGVSVVGGPTPGIGGPTVFSNMLVVLDGITVVAGRNPSVVAFDFQRCAQANIVTASALAFGTAAQLNTDRPTNTNGLALNMPRLGNNDNCNIGLFSCEGFYYGIGFGDHLTAQRIALIYVDTALFIGGMGSSTVHGSSILYASVEAANTLLECPGNAGGKYPIDITMVNVEVAGGTTIKDPNSNLRGTIHYSNDTGAAPTVTGANNLRLLDLNRDRGAAVAPAVPATTVALANPFFRDAAVHVNGGAVTAIAVDGTTLGVTSGLVIVPAGKSIKLTYTAAPTWVWTLL